MISIGVGLAGADDAALLLELEEEDDEDKDDDGLELACMVPFDEMKGCLNA